MEKKYIIGGLAIVGALALFAYLKPTTAKRNSEGFFGANGQKSRLSISNGTASKASSNGKCTICHGSSSNYWAVGGRCKQGDSCAR